MLRNDKIRFLLDIIGYSLNTSEIKEEHEFMLELFQIEKLNKFMDEISNCWKDIEHTEIRGMILELSENINYRYYNDFIKIPILFGILKSVTGSEEFHLSEKNRLSLTWFLDSNNEDDIILRIVNFNDDNDICSISVNGNMISNYVVNKVDYIFNDVNSSLNIIEESLEDRATEYKELLTEYLTEIRKELALDDTTFTFDEGTSTALNIMYRSLVGELLSTESYYDVFVDYSNVNNVKRYEYNSVFYIALISILSGIILKGDSFKKGIKIGISRDKGLLLSVSSTLIHNVNVSSITYSDVVRAYRFLNSIKEDEPYNGSIEELDAIIKYK